VVFIAQATNTPLSLGDLLLVLGVSLVKSKGAYGVPWLGHRHPRRNAQCLAKYPGHRPHTGAVSGLVHRHGRRRRQPDVQLRGDRGDRRVGGDLDHAKAKRVLDGKEIVDVTAG